MVCRLGDSPVAPCSSWVALSGSKHTLPSERLPEKRAWHVKCLAEPCDPLRPVRVARAGLRLKDKGRMFREAFLAKLALLLRGTVAAPPERFGETLADEHIRGGARPAPWPRIPCRCSDIVCGTRC